MSFKFTLLLLLSFSTIHAKDNLNAIEKLLEEDVQPLRTTEIQKSGINQGTISGQLFDRDSNELVDPDTSFNVNLFKKHPRFDDWVYLEGVDSENSAFEFNHLEHGQYLISVSRSGGGDSDLITIANKAYLNSVWSATGNHSCINCDLSSDRIITVDSNQAEVQADFELEKGGLLAVTLANDDLEQSDNFRIISINENNQVFDNSIQLTTVTGVGIPLTTGVDIKAISILPEGQYRFFTETYQLIDKTNEGIPCEYCEFDVLQNEVNRLPVVINQVTEASVSLTQSNSTVSGHIDVTESSDLAVAHLINYNLRTQVSKLTYDEPYGFTLNEVVPGIHFLKLNSLKSENNYHYRSIYGSSKYCVGICDLSGTRPIMVAESQDVMLQPYKMPLGGSVTGMINNSNGDFLLQDPGYPGNNDYHYIEIYDISEQFVGTVNIRTYSNGQPFDNTFQHTFPPGQYYIKTGSSDEGLSNRNYIDQVYPGINCAGFYCDFSEAELVTVEVGETLSGINFNLEKGFGIRGKITDTNYHELKDINILVHDEDFNFLGTTLTDDSGDYGFFNLPNGNYYVRTTNGSKSFNELLRYPETGGFQDQLYPNIDCPNGVCAMDKGELITVQNSDVSGINFQLSQDKALSGTVTDAKTGQPIEHLKVAIHKKNSNYVSYYKTNHLGYFITGSLEDGEYFIKTHEHNLYPEFVLGAGNCLFGNCNFFDGSVLTFDESQSVHFEISHKKDIYATFSGNWYQPNESGHGFQLGVIEQNDASHMYVTWYAHLNGQPIWLTGTGLLLGNQAYFDLNITDGQDFPTDNNIQHWGTLRIDFSDLNHATANWQPVLDGFSAGELEIKRLTELSSDLTPGDDIGACFSGSYYDPDRNGEGMLIEVLGNPADRLIITWYSYRGDEQFWMVGAGDLNGSQASVPMHYTQGTSFTPDFDTNDLETVQWGEVTVEKVDNLTIDVEFKPNAGHADFPNHQTQLVKLTEIHGLSCE